MKYKNNRYFKKYKNYKKIKWLLILSILIILINYIFRYNYLIIKFSVIILISTSILCLFFTKQGKKVLLFIEDSKNELLNITWPSKKETFFTTLIILTITTLMSLMLWALDSIIFHLISFII